MGAVTNRLLKFLLKPLQVLGKTEMRVVTVSRKRVVLRTEGCHGVLLLVDRADLPYVM